MNALHLYRALHPRKEPVYVNLGGGSELPASPLRVGQVNLRRYGDCYGKASANIALAVLRVTRGSSSARKGNGSIAPDSPPKFVIVPGWSVLIMLAVLTGGLSVGIWLGSVAVGAVW